VTYVPRPIDTDDVELEPALDRLLEQLAEHVHDLWAEARLGEGWTYGRRRDDVAKTHPGLVPYAELTDEEKAYDRRTAAGTLRAIVALGYRIDPSQRER
jgi:ryanodine receptor 2